MAGLAALASSVRSARAEEVGQSVRSVLEDPRYRFCHEDDYPLTPEEHAWCPMVGEISGACPGLPKACKLPPVPLSLRWGGFRTRDQGEAEPAERAPQEDGRQRAPEWDLTLPDMSTFARVLFFALLAVGLFFVVRAIVKNVRRDPAPEKDDEAAPTPDAPGPAEPAAKSAVETDVDRLLARARAAAARGDYARAVDDAYAALLRRLDGDGLIEIHPSRTNGDYVRRLGSYDGGSAPKPPLTAGRPDLKEEVRSIARDVEGVQFGATPPSEPVFRSVLERVLPLVGRALALALVFFGLSVGLSCAPHGRGGRRGERRHLALRHAGDHRGADQARAQGAPPSRVDHRSRITRSRSCFSPTPTSTKRPGSTCSAGCARRGAPGDRGGARAPERAGAPDRERDV